MGKSAIELAYERIHHELSLHWSRINLTWLIVTASFTGLGYVLFSFASMESPNGDRIVQLNELQYLLALGAAAAATLSSVVWRTIIAAGNIWVQLWEQKIGVLEYAADESLYLDTVVEHDPTSIRQEYAGRHGVFVKHHPSITIAYNYLAAMSTLCALLTLSALVMWPSVLGIRVDSDWRHVLLFTVTIVVSILIEWPIAIQLRNNNRVISELVVSKLTRLAEKQTLKHSSSE